MNKCRTKNTIAENEIFQVVHYKNILNYDIIEDVISKITNTELPIQEALVLINKKTKEHLILKGKYKLTNIICIADNRLLLLREDCYSVNIIGFTNGIHNEEYKNVEVIDDECMIVYDYSEDCKYLYNFKEKKIISRKDSWIEVIDINDERVFKVSKYLSDFDYISYIINIKGEIISPFYDTVFNQLSYPDKITIDELEAALWSKLHNRDIPENISKILLNSNWVSSKKEKISYAKTKR